MHHEGTAAFSAVAREKPLELHKPQLCSQALSSTPGKTRARGELACTLPPTRCR